MKMLCISADPDFPGGLRDLLDKASGEVLKARDVLEGWRLLDCGAARVDLCVLDERLPKAEASELLFRLRADHRFKSLRVVFCAGKPCGAAA